MEHIVNNMDLNSLALIKSRLSTFDRFIFIFAERINCQKRQPPSKSLPKRMVHADVESRHNRHNRRGLSLLIQNGISPLGSSIMSRLSTVMKEEKKHFVYAGQLAAPQNHWTQIVENVVQQKALLFTLSVWGGCLHICRRRKKDD